jgi:threonine aldolase
MIDIRSDTVTQPTQKMREAMYKAVVGDDVYEDDPTIKELESLSAEITGKEAALFVPSGTFGNQLALFTHCKRGNEVILADKSHIVDHEVGASSVIASVQLRTVECEGGIIPVYEIKKRVRRAKDDIHFPNTDLICLENAHSSGTVIPIEKMKEIYQYALENHIAVHLDGARLFNAATFLNVDPKEITEYADSVMFCLSKGLCAPVGSVLAGTRDFIEKARKKRKIMGGGLRQAGFLGAAGLVALEEMIEPLKNDHENAKELAIEMAKIPQIELDLEKVQINMIFFRLRGVDTKYIKEFFYKKKIKINGPENDELRFVTNHWIKEEDISYIVKILNEFIDMYKKG